MDDLKYSEHSYGPHELQCLSTWTFPEPLTGASVPVSKYWIIYIHGGAWRDPTITHTSLSPTIESLLSSSPARLIASIAGFASLSYRLSAHPSHPQDPASTPAAQLRNAQHPDHLLDVLSGLRFLQEHYGIGSGEYVLVGHSCGATLALQSVMDLELSLDRQQEGTEKKIALPKAIAGVCGIYDIRSMVEYERQWKEVYHQFVVGAFGTDESVWDSVSPAQNSTWVKTWAGAEAQGRVLLLASSAEDELIEDEQVGKMENATQHLKVGQAVSLRNQLTGGHDEIWKGGKEMAKVVVTLLEKIVEPGKQ